MSLKATGQELQAALNDRRNFVIRPIVACTLFSIAFQFTFTVGGLLLSPARVLFLAIVPVLLVRFLSGRYGRITLVDVLVLLHVSWMMMTIFLNHPLMIAITYTGSNALLILGGYLVARTMIRTEAEMRGMILVLIVLILFSLPFALLETRTSVMTLARLLDKIPGIRGSVDVNYDPRMGFHRVQFMFTHPIHYGLFCSVGFAFCLIGLRRIFAKIIRWVMSTAIALGTFLSLSSGPFLSLAGQVFLLGWGGALSRVPSRWRILAILGGIFYLVLEALSTRPAIYVIVSKLAFAPHTANLRLLLFEYGVVQVGRAPIFGIGFNTFPLPKFMSGSLDNHWLLQCIVFGLPAFILLMSALTVAFIRMARIKGATQDYNDLRLAWNVTVISLILTLATVAIWTEMLTLFYLIIGSGVWMTTYKPEAAAAPSADELRDEGRPPLRYSRFPARPRAGNRRPDATPYRRTHP